MSYIVFCDHGLPTTLSTDYVLPHLNRATREVGWRCRTVKRNGGTRTYISGRLAHSLFLHWRFPILVLDLNKEITQLPFGYSCSDYRKLKKVEDKTIQYLKSDSQKPSQ